MNSLSDPAPMLLVEDVAARLNVEVRFVRRLVAERRIPYFKIGAHLRFEATDVEAFIAAARQGVDA